MYRNSKVTFSIYQGPFPHNLFYWDKENRSLYQGLRCIVVTSRIHVTHRMHYRG